MRKLTFILLLVVALMVTACSPIAPDLAPASVDAVPVGLQIGLVITPAEGDVTTMLVSVPGDAPTALDALTASGVELAVAETDFGPAVCGILGTGQPVEDCFGDTEGRYWAFFTLNDSGEWEAAQVGVAGYPISDGQVLGFSWTASDANYNPLVIPPVVTLAEIAK